MSLVHKRLLPVAAAVALAAPLLAAAQPAAAAPVVRAGASQGSAASDAPVYRKVGDYSIAYPACVAAGEAGVQSGAWDAYYCQGQLVGLDVFWSLWVTP